MDIKEIKELLPLYAIGALDEDEYRNVSEYLSAHPEMMAEYESYLETVDSLRSLNMKAPDGLIDNIMERIQPEPSLMERIIKLLLPSNPAQRLVFISAAILLCLSLFANGVLLYNKDSGIYASVNLSGAEGAQGTLVISEKLDRAVLFVNGLPELDSAHTYQIWLIKDGRRTSGGIFNMSSGRAKLEIASAIPMTDYQSFGITIEPAGGSPAPTGIKVMGS